MPIAAHARLVQKSEVRSQKSEDSSLFTVHYSLVIDGLVGSVSGDRIIKAHIEGNTKDAESLGLKLAEDLLSKGAKEILDEVYGKNVRPVNGEIAS